MREIGTLHTIAKRFGRWSRASDAGQGIERRTGRVLSQNRDHSGRARPARAVAGRRARPTGRCGVFAQRCLAAAAAIVFRRQR